MFNAKIVGQVAKTAMMNALIFNSFVLVSFRRKPESSRLNGFWMLDQVQHDDALTFTKVSIKRPL
jgi:hypothetical protein